MRTTIDAAGRVVIPKAIREAADLVPGRELDVVERDGRIEIEPVSQPMALVERDGFLAAEPRKPERRSSASTAARCTRTKPPARHSSC